MSMAWVRALPMVLMLAVAACSMPSLTGNEDRNQDAQALMAALAKGDEATVVAFLTDENDAVEVKAQLPDLKSISPDGPVPEGNTTGWRSFVGTDGTTYEASRSYDYPDRVIHQNVIFRKQGESWKVHGFQLNATIKPGASPGVTPEPGEAGDAAPSQEPPELRSAGAEGSVA